MSRRVVETDKAPAAIGPYVQGVMANGLLFTSMQIGLDPTTGELVGASPAEQVQRCLLNVQAIVEAAGGTLNDVVKTTVYLTDLTAFGAVNQVYNDFFSAELPARGVVETAGLPKGALVAVEAIASVD
jgi:2-iminobutanoate/2-iminopropanoate deaminase